jgi:hypothetical protein
VIHAELAVGGWDLAPEAVVSQNASSDDRVAEHLFDSLDVIEEARATELHFVVQLIVWTIQVLSERVVEVVRFGIEWRISEATFDEGHAIFQREGTCQLARCSH